jgi:hypothetical protein
MGPRPHDAIDVELWDQRLTGDRLQLLPTPDPLLPAPCTDRYGVSAVEVAPGEWAVQLPHQCDNWEISGEAYGLVSRDQACADLRAFIAECQTVLDALRYGRPTHNPDA